MKKLTIYSLLVATLGFGFNSCIKDLDTIPLDPNEITSATVYTTPANYYHVLAKVYAGLAVSGQQGPAGQPDISGIDEGFSTYLRQYWFAQELPTDEAVNGWNDGTLRNFHEMNWTPSGEFITAMYNRIYYQISLCNEFIRESSDAKLDSRGIAGIDKTNIQGYRAEARFMRALSYYHAMDMFGNVPFVTDADAVGAFFPPQKNRADLFTYIESELKEVEPLLPDARTNEYGRADKGALWSLLAKLYLNAEVYTGTAKNAECITYCDKVIEAGYMLEANYQNNFLADNNLSKEIIFPVTFDGLRTKTYGGMSFIIFASVGGNMVPKDFGITGGWAGNRTTKALVHKFYPDLSGPLMISPVLNPRKSTYPLMYVPGSYQGWDPAKTSTVIASVKNDKKFEGYLYFKDAGAQFKFTEGPNWDVNYGDDGADGTLDKNGANIVAADAGYFKLNVDMNTLTYTVVKTEWGIIGSGTADGWNSDQNMTFDEATGLWTATLDLKVGDIKFRANNDWVINYGDIGADGILEQNGTNIPVKEAGTYNITMKLGAPDYTYTIVRKSYDHRALFHSNGQTLEIVKIQDDFNSGFAITKFKNVTSTGAPGSATDFVDTDFPMFRLADIYLMYAEAVVRGGGGSMSKALELVNDLRTRAYNDASANISTDNLTLDFILDERARELYWECTRRTDLIRFGKFTSESYLWPWKGNVK
ncbi:MAG: RagB/SusD family nutrient uptake outer membrane protein, partial [Bacteroidales bacterium]